MTLLKIFKALSEDIRLQMMLLLSKKDFCVCELTELLNISQPRASKHLIYLKNLNILKTYKDQKYNFYTINRDLDMIDDIVRVLKKHESDYQELLAKVDTVCRCMMEFEESNG